jgi:dTDP-4-amino-4,6-dideoxygalactose transaminase
VLVAHLFGGRIDLQPLAEFARRHGLLLIEDAAQAYTGPGYTGHPSADVSMFSFGPIKTATALGGAMLRVRDRRLLERMQEIRTAWPAQRNRDFLLRVAKYAALKAASTRPAYSTIVSLCRAVGLDHDRLVNSSVRGFANGCFFAGIRKQPSGALLRLMRQRLTRVDQHKLDERMRRAERIMGNLRGTANFPGSACAVHTHWLLPMAAARPSRLIQLLNRAGYDSTQGQSLIVVPPPVGRPDLIATLARETMAKIVFLPCYAEMPLAAVDRLADIVANETGSAVPYHSKPLRLVSSLPSESLRAGPWQP